MRKTEDQIEIVTPGHRRRVVYHLPAAITHAAEYTHLEPEGELEQDVGEQEPAEASLDAQKQLTEEAEADDNLTTRGTADISTFDGTKETHSVPVSNVKAALADKEDAGLEIPTVPVYGPFFYD